MNNTLQTTPQSRVIAEFLLLENHHKKLNMELNIAHYNVQKT
jgi:hypothetical protein